MNQPSRIGPPEPNGELVPASSTWAVQQFEPMHLRDYWDIVRRRTWMVLGVTLAGTALVAYWTATWSDYYESSARIEINPETLNPVVTGGESRPANLDDSAYFNTQLQLLTGPTLLRSVVTTLGLEHDETFKRHLPEGGRLLGRLLRLVSLRDGYTDLELSETPLSPGLRPSVTERELQEAQRLVRYVNALRDSLTVEQVKETRGITKHTRLVNITYRHPHPLLSAKIVNAVADAMALGAHRKRQGAGDATSDYLANRIEELKAEIAAAQARLVDYGTNHDIVSLESGQNVAVDRLLDLNRELTEAEGARKEAEAQYLAELSAESDQTKFVPESDTVRESKAQLAELERQKELLLVGATEKWPRVQEVTRQIEVLTKQIQESKELDARDRHAQLTTALREARLREESARLAFETQESATQDQNKAAVNYRLVEQEIATNQTLLSTLMLRQREHDLGLAGTEDNIRVVDYAITPDPAKPDGPLRLIFVGGAFVVFLAVGFGLAFFREYMNDTFRSEEELREALQVKTLAAIPAVHQLEEGPLMRSMGLVEYHMTGPSSALEDDYRRLRTTIVLATQNKSSRTLLITSSVAGEGKTTTAINLACSFQRNGSHVLLIDGDLRRPRIHHAFGGSNEIGLSNILSASEPPADGCYDGFVHWDERTGVSYVPSGPSSENSTELLGSRRMGDFLAWASTQFDLVIADSPSLTSCADPMLLAHQVESVVLVVSAGESSRELVEESKRLLVNAGADLLGVVLNNADKRHAGYPDKYRRPEVNGHSGRKRTSILIRRK
jgi:capsular exopolysaccharide synthesis family protein